MPAERDRCRDDRPPDREWDVVVVGSGPAGASAGVFAARAGLETCVFDRGSSSIRQCAYLENFLGFPAGIDVPTFCDLARAHLREAGATVVEETVESVARADGGFRVETDAGRVASAEHVVAASTYDASYLRGIDDGALFPDGEFVRDADERGRTPVAGLYLAGPLAGVPSQAIVAAGHGAMAALALLEDRRLEAGYWRPVSAYHDWVVPDGRYGGPDWHGAMDEWFDANPPPERSLGDPEVRDLLAAEKRRRLDMAVDEDERDRRTRRGHAVLRSFLRDARDDA
ncbi:NAD(P)/FAD-dependent oxidoreductase [Halomarina halobia]|uniref:NAD(P)/FAD-dependent oxidoreductase n=1 Tax=Halomarina halobia TaxID=3033386 RepID=A0ABD6AA02_9EURY|nr:NAD(P)/FAD-dependent oxidoreductase [Halomarina sp. PSR21]